MPRAKIEVTEYECRRCGYRWINRINGKDGPVPNRCARCKKLTWDRELVSDYERGLRTQVNNLTNSYYVMAVRCSDESIMKEWPKELVKRFLEIRPTTKELGKVLYHNDSKTVVSTPMDIVIRYEGYVPNPDKPGFLKYDMRKYIRLVKEESRKRQEIMQQVINSRIQADQPITVVNLKNEEYDVYIGRENKRLGLPGSKWGNPFVVGIDGTQKGVVEKHRSWLTTGVPKPRKEFASHEVLRNSLHELWGKLGCYCKPLPCHGDTLKELAEAIRQ